MTATDSTPQHVVPGSTFPQPPYIPQIEPVHMEDRAFLRDADDPQRTMCGLDLRHAIAADKTTRNADRVTCADCLAEMGK